MKLNKITTGMLAGIMALVVILLISGCTTTENTVKEESVKIGYLAPMTGFAAYWGIPNVQGAEIAKADINDAGGINGKQLEIIYEDTKSDPKETVIGGQKLINQDNIVAGISEFAPMSIAVAPVFKEAKTPFIYDAYITSILEGNDYAFKVSFDAKTECRKMTEYAKEKGLYDNLGAIFSQTEYGQACFEGMKEVEPDMKAYFYNFGDNDFRSLFAKAKEDNIDTIGAMGFTEEMTAMYAQMVEQDYDFNILCGSSSECLFEGMFNTIPSSALEGSIAFDYEDLDKTDFAKKFYAKYPDAQPEELLPAAVAYEQVTLIAEAAKMCDNVSRECVRENLANVRDYPTAFNSKGFKDRILQIDSVLYTVKDGKVVEVE